MTDIRTTAWSALHDPSTSGGDLAAIAAAHPEFAATIAQHPNAYPELVAWAQAASAPSTVEEPSADEPTVDEPAVDERAVDASPLAGGSSGAAPDAPVPSRLGGMLWGIAFGGFVGVPLVLETAQTVSRATGSEEAWGDYYSFWIDSWPLSAGLLLFLIFSIAALVGAAISAPTIARRLGAIALVAVSTLTVAISPLIGFDLWWPLWSALWDYSSWLRPVVWAGLLFAAWALSRPLRGAGWAALPIVVVLPVILELFVWSSLRMSGWSSGFGELIYITTLAVDTVIVPIVGVFFARKWSAASERRAARRPLPVAASGGSAGAAPIAGTSGTSRTNTMAILSLVFGFLISVLAIVFGHLALSQIRRTGEEGRGLAIAGLVLGYVGIGLGIITIIIYGVTFGALFSQYGY